MQSRGHAPHSVVSHNPSQAEGCDHLSECSVGGDDAQSQTGGHTYKQTDRAEQCCCVCMPLHSSFHTAVVGKMCSCLFPVSVNY